MKSNLTNNTSKNGLNNVPKIVYDKEVVISEIEDEVKKACSNLYTSLVGEYPKAISYKDSVDIFIRNLKASIIFDKFERSLSFQNTRLFKYPKK